VSSENNLNHFTLIFLSLKKIELYCEKKYFDCFARTNKKKENSSYKGKKIAKYILHFILL